MFPLARWQKAPQAITTQKASSTSWAIGIAAYATTQPLPWHPHPWPLPWRGRLLADQDPFQRPAKKKKKKQKQNNSAMWTESGI